jgi:hypothetical protein
MMRISMLVLVIGTLSVGCKKKDGEGGGAASGPAKLPKLGLVIDVPGEVTVGDAVMGEGNMLQGSSVGAMQVEVEKKTQTLDEAKADADMYSPKNVKAETLSDGWALSFENKGSMGANFFVDVRRTIDGKLYKCWVTTGEAKQAEAVLAACKTLKKG